MVTDLINQDLSGSPQILAEYESDSKDLFMFVIKDCNLNDEEGDQQRVKRRLLHLFRMATKVYIKLEPDGDKNENFHRSLDKGSEQRCSLP